MIKALTYVILILFCWIIYPYKWITKAVFLTRMNNAKKKANKRALQVSDTVYVVQWGKRFFVGVRSEMKKMDKKAAKMLKLTVREAQMWDYRNCIIYKTKAK